MLAIGGSAGTTIGTAAMRALPWGVPKVMVSTLASGQVRQFVGHKDIFMLNSVVDIAGVNRLSRPVLDQAARAMAGLVGLAADTAGGSDKPLVAATMFGVTTPCVEHARAVLEQAGCEVVVFHATGAGGEAMESLVREGLIQGVLDITTTELADELVGGFLSAGPDRLYGRCRVRRAAGRFGRRDRHGQFLCGQKASPRSFAAGKFPPAQRQCHVDADHAGRKRAVGGRHRPQGGSVARDLPAMMFPLGGVSAIDGAGGAFDDPVARQALLAGLEANQGTIELVQLDSHINDPAFAEAAARRLIEFMAARAGAGDSLLSSQSTLSSPAAADFRNIVRRADRLRRCP